MKNLPTTRILDKIQVEKVKNLANDKDLIDALKKIFLTYIYRDGAVQLGEEPDVQKNFALSLPPNTPNDIVGQHCKAVNCAITFFLEGFEEIEKYKQTPPPKKTGRNPAT